MALRYSQEGSFPPAPGRPRPPTGVRRRRRRRRESKMGASASPSSLPSSLDPPPLPPTETSPPLWNPSLDSIPDGVALVVAAFLGPGDLCSLGSCSRFWRRLCSSDSLWASLIERRWPSLCPPPPSPSRGGEGGGSSPASSSADGTPTLSFPPSAQGWKSFYVGYHQEMARRASKVIKFVKQCSQNDSLEAGDFLKAVAALHSLKLGFVDIKFFLLTVKHSVLLNLVGLHYMMFYLKVPDIDVMDALRSSQISGRQVRVNWFKLDRWSFYSFRLPDGSCSRKVSLLELASSEEEVRNMLNIGAIPEVLRVQIVSVISSTT